MGSRSLPDFELKIYHGFSESLLDVMCELEAAIFDTPYSREALQRKCEFKHQLLGLIAFIEDRPVAFKVGYELSDRLYYSWLGGVVPTCRRSGLATHLMKIQHKTIADMGYQSIRTHTHNKFRPMLLLNIQSGFNVVGVISNPADSEPTIVLDRPLQDICALQAD